MQYRVVYSADFEKAAMRLGKIVLRRLEKALDLLVIDPFDSRLHTKALAGPLRGFYSFRLGRDFRVIFIFADMRTIQLLKIAKRAEIYK